MPDREHALFGELSRINNELVDLQRTLAKSNAELEQLNQEKNQLLGIVAHELRTPLGIVSSYAQLLAEEAGPAVGEEQRAFVLVIQRTVAGMVRLVDGLLDLARIEAGRLDLTRTAVDLVDLVLERVALHRILAAPKGVVIEAAVPDAPVVAIVDGPKVGQVLDNLVTNAVKFSEPGREVRIRLVDRVERVELSVADRGVGITEHDQESLFAPFAGARRSGTDGERGAGLGLAIVKRFVDGHGGRIAVASTSGVGSTFTVVLPKGSVGS